MQEQRGYHATSASNLRLAYGITSRIERLIFQQSQAKAPPPGGGGGVTQIVVVEDADIYLIEPDRSRRSLQMEGGELFVTCDSKRIWEFQFIDMFYSTQGITIEKGGGHLAWQIPT